MLIFDQSQNTMSTYVVVVFYSQWNDKGHREEKVRMGGGENEEKR